MDHFVSILHDCIIPFLDPFDISKFMLVSHAFYKASQEAVKPLTKKYLVHYCKNGQDIKYVFSDKADDNKDNKDNKMNGTSSLHINYRNVTQLQIFRAHDPSLVNFDMILHYCNIQPYYLEYHYNTSPSIIPDKYCYGNNFYVWIAPRSFSISFHGPNHTILYIYTRDHYGLSYEQTYNDIVNVLKKYREHLVHYSMDYKYSRTTLTKDSIMFFSQFPFIYPAHHVLDKTITFSD